MEDSCVIVYQLLCTLIECILILYSEIRTIQKGVYDYRKKFTAFNRKLLPCFVLITPFTRL